MSDAASSYPDVFFGWAQRTYAPLRNAKKRLAADADTSHRTSEHWLSKKHPPKVSELIRLMARNDELAAEIWRLVEETKCGV